MLCGIEDISKEIEIVLNFSNHRLASKQETLHTECLDQTNNIIKATKKMPGLFLLIKVATN